MGFYGRSSSANSNFIAGYQFDKVYASRAEMDKFAATDLVYIGRNVLVEYDNKPNVEFCIIEQSDDVNYDPSNKQVDWVVQELSPEVEQDGKIAFYKFVLHYKDLYGENPTKNWLKKEITYVQNNVESTNIFNYTINEHIDRIVYDTIHDSTVWVKRESGYLSIASLNSITPDFSVIVDAPLTKEQDYDKSIYFDTDSTKLTKILHIPTNWKFQLGDIDLNLNGFDSSNKDAYIENPIDKLEIIDTKSSNNIDKNDTKQLNISIQSIGNTISDVWDIIYGPERDNSKTSSIQGILNSFEEIPHDTFPIKRASDGQIVGAAFNQALENSVNYKYYGNANIYPTSIELFEIVNTVGDKVTLTFKADKKEILEELPIIAIPYEYIDTNQNVFEVNAFHFPVNIEILTLKTLYIPSTVKTISSQKGNNIVIINSIKINSVLQNLQLPYFYCQDGIINIIPDSSNFNSFIWGGKFQGMVFDKVLNLQNNLADIDKIYLYNAETIEHFDYGYSTIQTKVFLPATLSKINQIQKPKSDDILPIFYYEGLREDFKKIEGCDKIIDLEDAQNDKFLIYYKNDEEYKKQIRSFEEIKLNFELNRYKELDRWIQASVQYNNEDENPYINIEHLKVNPEIATQYKLGPFNFVIDEAGHIINTAHQEEMVLNCGGAQL